MKIKLLNEFSNKKINFSSELLSIISTKDDNGVVFPPYIPLIGTNYENLRILVYSTAQNIGYDSFRLNYQNNFSKLAERLYFFDNFLKKYPENIMNYNCTAIKPYEKGVLAALLGVFIYAKFRLIIDDINDIHNHIAITNYYKFSLNIGKKDINPEPKGKNKINKLIDENHINCYYEINDDLVKKEIEILKPNLIISFNGRKTKKLEKITDKKIPVFKVNDPSWILNGGGGVFGENKSWYNRAKNCNDKVVKELISNYLNYIDGNYKGKKESVRIYLLKYFKEWNKDNAR